MKKFISVILAALMLVTVMPFAIFAADEYKRPANEAHACHPTKDGALVLGNVDMAKDATVVFTKAATDTGVNEYFLTDGKANTATRLPVGATAKLTVTFAEAKDLATFILTVNGKGSVNPTYEVEDKTKPIYKIVGYEQIDDTTKPVYVVESQLPVYDTNKPIYVQAFDEETGDPLYVVELCDPDGDGNFTMTANPEKPILVHAEDADGNKLYEQKVDEDGNLVWTDVYKQLVVDGKPVFDKDGKPVYEQKMVDGKPVWEKKDNKDKPIYEIEKDEYGRDKYTKKDGKEVVIVEVQKEVDGKKVYEQVRKITYKALVVDEKPVYAQKWDAEQNKFVDDTSKPLYVVDKDEMVDDTSKPVMVEKEKEVDKYDTESDPVYVITGYEKKKVETPNAGEVKVDSKHDLQIVLVAKDADGKVVYSSDADAEKEGVQAINTKDLTTVTFDIFEKVKTIEITTVGAAKANEGGPRIWEVDATTVAAEKDYAHTWVNTITKLPSLGVKGEYTRKCSVCGYADPNPQEIAALTHADFTAGKLTADDVTFEEVLKLVDKDGNALKDDDGNEIPITKPTQAKPENLFDGNKNSGGLWNANGSYWTASQEGQLTIKFKEAKLVSYLYITVTFNAWPGISFEFYNGKDLVAKTTGNWKNDQTPDDRWTNTWENKTIDFGTDYGINGKTIDKIVIKFNNQVSDNYRKISEIEVGCHTHVYDDSLITSANGVRVEGKTCEYTFADASKVVCRECGVAAVGDKDGKVTLTLHDYPETVVDGKVVFDQSKASVTAATCGKDGKIEYTCSHKFNDTTKPVYARYFKKVDGKDVPVYGNNNQQLYLGKDGKGYDGTKITDWSTIVIEKYSDTACADKLVEVIPATGAHKGTTTTVRMGKYPTCGATGTAYVICTDCKQRVDIATAADLVKYGLATDANALKGTNLDKSFTDEATGKAYTVRFAVDANGKVTSIAALTTGYHTTGYKNVVASTYTKPGIDCAYCTTCGATFNEITKEAALAVPNAKVRFIEFSLRTTEFEGVRGTFSLNNEVIKAMQAAGYNVRIYIVVTNEAGVSKELQVYGAGAKATVALDGRFNVVVKGAAADDTLTFSYKVVVDDEFGTAENVVELASASIEDVKAAK